MENLRVKIEIKTGQLFVQNPSLLKDLWWKELKNEDWISLQFGKNLLVLAKAQDIADLWSLEQFGLMVE